MNAFRLGDWLFGLFYYHLRNHSILSEIQVTKVCFNHEIPMRIDYDVGQRLGTVHGRAVHVSAGRSEGHCLVRAASVEMCLPLFNSTSIYEMIS